MEASTVGQISITEENSVVDEGFLLAHGFQVILYMVSSSIAPGSVRVNAEYHGISIK